MKFEKFNGIYAATENSAAFKIFLALGFDDDTAFSLSYDAAFKIYYLQNF